MPPPTLNSEEPIYALLSADADTVCGARWCHQEPQRHVQRNRYRYRPLDTRAEPLTWRSPSCAQAPTSQSGCCNAADAPTVPYPRR